MGSMFLALFPSFTSDPVMIADNSSASPAVLSAALVAMRALSPGPRVTEARFAAATFATSPLSTRDSALGAVLPAEMCRAIAGPALATRATAGADTRGAGDELGALGSDL